MDNSSEPVPIGKRRADEIAALLARRLADAERLSVLGVAVPADVRPAVDRRRYMRVWIAREDEIVEALRAYGGATLVAMLRECRARLPDDGQRMTCTQADLAAELGLQPSEVSRAFKALAAVGAVMLPRRSGKSQSWEVDAEFASRLPDDRRDAAIDRQRREVAEAHAVAARKARMAGVGFREAPFPEGSIVDRRQADLLKRGGDDVPPGNPAG